MQATRVRLAPSRFWKKLVSFLKNLHQNSMKRKQYFSGIINKEFRMSWPDALVAVAGICAWVFWIYLLYRD